MALFIHRDNQTILWEILQERPEIHVLTPSERPAWFKHHIQQFYENLPATWFQQPLTTNELNRLNQTVLRTMLETLGSVPVDRRVAQSQPFPDTRTMGSAFQDLDRPTASRIPPRGPVGGPEPGQSGATGQNGTSGSHLHEQFLQKQEEMKTFLQRPPPQQIDFKVTELDTPIANMDELIQQQLRERENLILPPPPTPPQLSPPPPAPPAPPPPPSTLAVVPPPVRTLNISSNDPLPHNILNILPMPPVATETSGNRERTVAFEEPDTEQMKRDIRALQQDYRELENQLAALVLKMSATPTTGMNRARSW